MFKRISVALLLLTSMLFASLAFADDPLDPSTGEKVVPAGGMAVVTVIVSAGSAGGKWIDFASDDGGALDLVLVSKDGVAVQPSMCGANFAEGDRYLFTFSNTTGSPVDVTVTMHFESGGLACPPL